MASRLEIKDMQMIAADYGGKCLSKEYINMATPLEWMCSKGHTWDAPYSIILQGGWCVQCAKDEKKKLSLEEFQEIAKERGGKLLSEKYTNNKARLKWRCKEGHVWIAKPGAIKKGTWCPTCAHHNRRCDIEEWQQLAGSRKGKLLSKNYTNKRIKLKWQCANGHIWMALPHSVKAGNWCEKCSLEKRKKTVLESIEKIAKSKGGKLLSKKYVDLKTPVKWQCSKGHIWLNTPKNIKSNSWCPTCASEKGRIPRNNKLSINIFQKIAEQKGGACLSSAYIDYKTKLEWQCSEGHKWLATPASVKKGTWCPHCSYNRKKPPIEKFQKIAENLGGKLISKEYINKRTKLKFKCAKGHIWMTLPHHVNEGLWCSKCGPEKGKLVERRKQYFKEFQKIAKERGGKLLSDQYPNSSTKLKWQCAKGHIWNATPATIKKHWCPECGYERIRESRKLTIDVFQKMARSKKGKLLSKKYEDIHTPLKWQCREGHVWIEKPSNIKQGSWCWICKNKNNPKKKRALKELAEIAKKHKGKLLANEYVNNHTKLKWQCAKGHVWDTKPNIVQQGSWCPVCANQIRYSWTVK